MNKISLPPGFKETELPYITFQDGDEILGYCRSCTKNPSCKMNETLRQAMGENFPYWHQKFIVVKFPTPHHPFNFHHITTFCTDYENPQLNLPEQMIKKSL